MCKTCNTTETPSPALETYCDVTEDHDEGKDHSDECVSCDVVRNCRTYLVRAYDTVRVVLSRCELLDSEILSVEALECLVEDTLNLSVNL